MLPTIEEIRKLRKNLGISQKELSSAVGVSQSYVARLEKGSLNPTYNKVKKIYEFLNQSTEKLHSISLTVEKIMNRPVVTCLPYDTLIAALDVMRTRGFSQLPVANDDGNIIGVISESDINDLLMKGNSIESLRNMSVRKVMTGTLPQLDKLSQISMTYPLLKFSNAVIIVDSGRPVGIVTKADILKAIEDHA
ncbi:MAG: CBS domain-containing protein [Thermoplasmatales archaeon]|nr:CBS domain-containing protein [Thermoplasmatales archaeon]MCW6170731.1 CBS domain-containing protein [Thermoplasmatales archaeon]